jgi:hypothetical protein
MISASRQPGLFDTAPETNRSDVTLARARMLEMIDLLRNASAPPWTDQTAVILQDGAFRRAMRLVPADEAEALWAEFDAHTERLYAIWTQAEPAAENS